jgi:hypothetical protein
MSGVADDESFQIIANLIQKVPRGSAIPASSASLLNVLSAEIVSVVVFT